MTEASQPMLSLSFVTVPFDPKIVRMSFQEFIELWLHIQERFALR